MKKKIFILFVLLSACLLTAQIVLNQETCPEGNGWTKVETAGDPMSITIEADPGCLIDDVCTKRATIIDWFWDQFVAIFTVSYDDHAISHYSYTQVCEPDNTSTPTATPTETGEPTSTVTATATATVTATFTADPTATLSMTPTSTVTATNDPEQPTKTPTEPEEPTPTDTPEEPTETPTPTHTFTPEPSETPIRTPTKLPNGGPVFRTNLSLDAWRISSLNTWAGHNGLDRAIGESWVSDLWEGDLYFFGGAYWIVESRFKVSPWDTWVIDSAPLVLLSCSDWTGREWMARWVWQLTPLTIPGVQ